MQKVSFDRWPDLVETFLMNAKRPLIVVLGPTCSGKTAFSVALAKEIESRTGISPANARISRVGEIINADSRQLYRHLDIGTAKVTVPEKEGVSHHLFDVLDPSEEVTVAWYKEKALATIDEILARQQVPILAGGSMLYISSVIDGLEPLPPVEKVLRERIEAAYDEDKGQTLYARLQEVDPETASAFHANNRPYLVRAMAMYEVTGIAPSLQKKTHKSPYDLLMLGMYWERRELTKRIEARTPLLLQNGWVAEVQHLRVMGYDVHTPAMKSHGYREVLCAIGKAEAAGHDLLSVAQDSSLIQEIDLKTRQYAKRQMTWWKHDSRIHWLEQSL